MMAVTEAAQDIFDVPLPDSKVVAFTPAKDGLPVFHGKTFEDHVEAWHYVNESVECRLWALGAIAASLVTGYGEETVKKFAGEVRLSRWRIYEIADTYRKFEKSKRSQILSFHHHTVAAKAKDPVDAIHKAEDKEWSTRQLNHYVETGFEPPAKSESPSVKGMQSPARKLLMDHIEFEALAALLDLKTKCPNPQFASKYYGGWIQDLREAKDEIQREDATDALISAWKNGNHTDQDLTRATGLPRNFILSVMHDLEEEGTFTKVDQGGKTDVGRGERSTLWHLVGEPLGSDLNLARTGANGEQE